MFIDGVLVDVMQLRAPIRLMVNPMVSIFNQIENRRQKEEKLRDYLTRIAKSIVNTTFNLWEKPPNQERKLPKGSPSNPLPDCMGLSIIGWDMWGPQPGLQHAEMTSKFWEFSEFSHFPF